MMILLFHLKLQCLNFILKQKKLKKKHIKYISILKYSEAKKDEMMLNKPFNYFKRSTISF